MYNARGRAGGREIGENNEEKAEETSECAGIISVVNMKCGRCNNNMAGW